MKCPNCNTENRDGAKFCRNCGKELVSNEQSIREKYPEYSFELTTVTKMKTNSSWTVLVVIIFILFAFSIILTVNAFAQDLVVFATDIKVAWLFLTLAMVFLILLIKVYGKVKKIDLSSQFDYFENGKQCSSTYKFVIKDSKFGLFCVRTRSLQIPCDYDYLKWKVKDKILMATMNGNHFEIDINGNKLK